MFRIHFYVDDKHLADVLRGVSGKARQLSVEPVVNVVQEKDKRGKPNGKLHQDAEHTLGLFCKELKKALGDEPINATTAKAVLSKIGMSPTSYSHFLQQAVKANLIKRGKQGKQVIWSWV
jgi:hypothetical protein